MATCPVVNLGSMTSEEARGNPVDFYRRLLAEAPVYRDPVTGAYIITRYDDIAYTANNPQIFSSQNEIMMGRGTSVVAEEVHRRFREHGFPEVHTLVTADPPVHTRFRQLVEKVFTTSYVKSLEPMILATANELIDGFAADGKVELAGQFANLLPLYVIADQLGVDRADWRKIRKWSDVAVERADPALPPERELELTDGMIEMQQYLYGFVKKYRETPNDSLLSKLVHVEHDGERLSDGELMSIGHQLMVGGNETTANTIVAVMHELMLRPQLLAEVLTDPAKIPAVIEEVLRLHPPSPSFPRTTKLDCEVGGVPIPAGSAIMVSYMAANYDTAKFECPEQLNINRKALRQHLAFGRGVHFCIGHVLAKAELKIAIERLLVRLPGLRESSKLPKSEFVPHAFVHMLDGLNLEFEPS